MNVKLLNQAALMEGICGSAAALCTGSDNHPAALAGALASGHESVIEHANFTFHIEGVSRVLLAQLTRHRLASFSVQSQRYCGVTREWIVPMSVVEAGLANAYWAEMNIAFDFYEQQIAAGVPEEDARYAIPQGVTCNLVMTMNARELRHFFSLRCCNRAQWEIRMLADKMLDICQEVAPSLFKNAGCACMAGKPCPEKRPCGHPRERRTLP